MNKHTVSCSYSKDFIGDDLYTIPDLLLELKLLCEEKLQLYKGSKREEDYLNKIIEGCENWNEDEFIII